MGIKDSAAQYLEVPSFLAPICAIVPGGRRRGLQGNKEKKKKRTSNKLTYLPAAVCNSLPELGEPSRMVVYASQVLERYLVFLQAQG